MTYTIRMDTAEHDLLKMAARIYGTKPSALSVQILSDGIHELLTPEGIDRWIEEQWGPIRAAAIEMQKENLAP